MSSSPVRDALIVAGGRGTRLRPLTDATPKPLVPFAGEMFLLGVIRRLAAAGVEHVHLVVGQDTSPFDVLKAPAAEFGVTVSCVPEPEPLDTAGGVREVARTLTAPFFCCNGDILTDVDFAAVAERHVASGADATLVLERVEDTSTFGVCVRDGSRIVEFVEKPEPGTLPGQDTINAGTYVLEPHVFDRYEAGRLSFERQVFPELAASGGHIEGYVHEGVWADLGTPDRFRDGHRMALDGLMDWPALTSVEAGEHGVRIEEGAVIDPSAEIVGPVLIQRGARVGADAVVGPHTVLGPGVEIGQGAVAERSILWDRAALGNGVRAVGLLAGRGARVTEGAKLGVDNVLGDDVVIAPGERLADLERRPEPAS